MDFRDTKFDRPRLYCAWDTYNDKAKFFRSVDILADAGIRHRFWLMAKRGIRPYPMVYLDEATGAPRNGLPVADLKRFQRWAIMQRYHGCAFAEFDDSKRDRRKRPDPAMLDLFAAPTSSEMIPA